MTLSATQGSAVALMDGLVTLIGARLPAILAELQTAYGLTLPNPAQVYVGSIPDTMGGWPAVGVLIETSTYETMTSPCYRVAHTVALSLTLDAGDLSVVGPSGMHRATVAYVEAVARAVAKWATSDMLALAVWRAEIVDVTAQDTPYVAADKTNTWDVRHAIARVMIHQEIEREES